MARLQDKVALVTGGGRGIGRAISLALAREGAQVVLTYVTDGASAAAAVDEIVGQGGRARALPMDVTRRPTVAEVMRTIEKDFSRLNILVNNAGVNEPADFDAITDAQWDRILAVDLKGPFICSQEALPLMRKAGGGSIIHIGSVSGQYGGPRTAHYAAAKAGLISLGQVIARFGAGDRIRSNTIAAGLIASDMADQGLAHPSVKKATEAIMLGRMGTTREIADTAVFLASDESAYITAQTINVNGGLYF